MRSSDQLIERAVRLSALALQTREEGHLEFAKVLARLATESYKKAAKLKSDRKPTRGQGG